MNSRRLLIVLCLPLIWQSTINRFASADAAQSNPADAKNTTAQPAEDIRPGFAAIDSVAAFRTALASDNQKIRLRPGVYRISDAAYSPLLVMPYKQTRRADIALQLSEAASELGDHPLALITGDNGHRIRFVYLGETPPATLRPIIVGSVGDRYTEENTDPKALNQNHAARRIQLENLTPHPVQLTQYADECRISSRGTIEDLGKENVCTRPETQTPLD